MNEMKSATKEENVGASNVPSPSRQYEYSPVEIRKLKWGKKKRKNYVEITKFYAKNIQPGGRELLKIDLQHFSFTICVISNSIRGFYIMSWKGEGLILNVVKAPF